MRHLTIIIATMCSLCASRSLADTIDCQFKLYQIDTPAPRELDPDELGAQFRCQNTTDMPTFAIVGKMGDRFRRELDGRGESAERVGKRVEDGILRLSFDKPKGKFAVVKKYTWVEANGSKTDLPPWKKKPEKPVPKEEIDCSKMSPAELAGHLLKGGKCHPFDCDAYTREDSFLNRYCKK